jgi:hypothetical protein
MNTSALTNYDLFEDLFNFIKNPDTTINEAIKEYGGTNYYIPSYKTTCRNDEIVQYYKDHLGTPKLIKIKTKNLI